MKYLSAFLDSFNNTLNWIIDLILLNVPWYNNYFYGLIIISLIVWVLEILFPWRKEQSVVRKDFWLDAFYMFFNFFIFSLFISGFYSVSEEVYKELGGQSNSIALINLGALSMPLQLIIFFILSDFVQWFTHILLHRVQVFWNFHKVHHSVEEMGFAAHMRYHWMENVLYKPLKLLVIMLIGGFEPSQAYIVHFIAISIGHLNHANVKLSWGPLKYIFNNPVMHLWHHAKDLPKDKKYGVNYGISLSLWDYIFKTNYIPKVDGEIKLGFPDSENFPKDFLHQNSYGFRKND